MLPLIDLHSQLDEALNINSDDSIFDFQYYTDLINEQRSIFVTNEYNKNRAFDSNILQTIPCAELELVDPHNCCVEIPIGCKILRTKEPIPNTIKLFQGKAITSVGPVIITEKRFSLVEYERVPYLGHGRTTTKTKYAFLYDNYIYIVSKDPTALLLKKIAIRGIFEDPTALADFIDCSTGNTCWSPNDIYPLSLAMWAYMKQQIVAQLLPKLQIGADNNNNAHDDTVDERAQPSQPKNNK